METIVGHDTPRDDVDFDQDNYDSYIDDKYDRQNGN